MSLGYSLTRTLFCRLALVLPVLVTAAVAQEALVSPREQPSGSTAAVPRVPGDAQDVAAAQEGVTNGTELPTASPPPRDGRAVGDTCANAIVIPALPYSDSRDTCKYLNDYDEVCPFQGSTAADVVYAYTPTEDEAIAVTLCDGPTAYDTKVYIYEDICPDWGNPIACNDDACDTPQVPGGYVSQLGGVRLTAGHTYYIIVDGFETYCGVYHLDVFTEVAPWCPDDSVYGQAVHPPAPPWEGQSTSTSVPVFDDFAGVDRAIDEVTWWGVSALCCWNPCDPTGMMFRIQFYQDAAGTPGPLLCEYLLTPNQIETYALYLGFPLYHFTATLDPPCYVGAGWVSVQRVFSPNDCLCLWMSSPDGDGTSWWDDDGLRPLLFDRAFCLRGSGPVVLGACCDEAAGMCAEGVAMSDCVAPARFLPSGTCVDFVPPCGDASGACCLPNGNCAITTADACGGLWLGADTMCDMCPCLVPCIPDEGEPQCYDDYDDQYNAGCNAIAPMFQPIVCGQTICGTSGTFTYSGSPARDTDWFELITTSGGSYQFEVEAEFPVQVMMLDGNAGCADPDTIRGASVGSCNVATLSTPCLPAGRYWFWVGPIDATVPTPCGARYTATLTCTVPMPDLEVMAPGSWSGNTCGAGNDETLQPSPDHSYRVTIPTAGTWIIDLCGAAWDTVLYLGTDCSLGDVAMDDNGCDPASRLELELSPGDYWLTIEGSVISECGTYTLNISFVEPCSLECDSAAMPEGEATCFNEYVDTHNGGCDAMVPVFQPIQCGDFVCGRSGVFQVDGVPTRDSDWYELVTTDEGVYTWTVEAEFDVLLSMIDAESGDCAEYTVVAGAVGDACTTATLQTSCLPSGRYWLKLQPQDLSGVVCGAIYNAELTCEPCPFAYCAASGGCDERHISNVTFANIDHSSDAQACDSSGGYSFHAAPCAHLERGSDYTISISSESPGEVACGMWIDWNVDGAFSHATESVPLTGSPGMGPFTGTIAVPAAATLGETRLRIRLKETMGLMWPCGTTARGEVEDYCITIVDPSVPGDLDGDQDVDSDDFAIFAVCLAGPNVLTPPAGCDPDDFTAADLSGDGDVDVQDFALFQQAFTGGG